MNKEKLKRRQEAKIEASYIALISNDPNLKISFNLFKEDRDEAIKELEEFKKLNQIEDIEITE